jgi:hypothetical protein
MKKIIQFFAFLALLNSGLKAQNGTPQNAGARGAAMGNASVTFSDINSAFSNQAGLAFLEGLSFTAYGERRFLAEGLNSYLFAAAFPDAKIGTFGLSVNYFGFKDYNEQKIGLAYARKLAKNFSLGVQLDYLGTRIPNYGAAHSVTVEIGLLAKLSEKFSLGAHIYNPTHSKVGAQERLPSLVNIGLAYSPSKKVTLTGQLEKDIYDHPFAGRVGVEYRPVEALSLRAGIVASEAAQASFGIGVLVQSLRIDFATSYHQILGFTPSVSLSYGIVPVTKTKIVPEVSPE